MIPDKSADILILNGTLVTCDPDNTITENSAVAVIGDKIVAAGPKEDFSSWNASQVIDAGKGIIMPGLVNAHTHLPMSLFRGLADDLPLETWLNDHIFPAEGQHINPETVKTASFLSCAEMLLSGTTTCCDGYFYEDVVAEAVYETGMRAVLGQGVIDFPAPGVPDPKNNIKNAANYTAKWLERYSAISPSIFCHSPYTCSANTLKQAKDASNSKGVLFQIHVAETREERDRSLEEHQVSPIKYLESIGLLDERTLLVHAVWLDEEDIKIIADSNARVCHNPESNMKLASGTAKIPELLNAGVTVGLGTDGCASNNNLDMFQEMDFAAKLHKINTGDPTVMDSRTVLKMATAGSADAIGLGEIIGSIEEGKQADMIILDTRSPHFVPMYDPISQLVYSASGSDVRDVIINGKVIVKDRKLLTVDLDDILEKAEKMEKQIKLS